MYTQQLLTSSGRIRKIMLFDTCNYTITDNSPEYEAYNEIRMKHLDMINGMHALNNEIWFYVFYHRNTKGVLSGVYTDHSIRTKFIAVNACISKLYLPTRWVQNVFLVGPSKNLLYDNVYVASTLAELVAEYLGFENVTPIYKKGQGDPDNRISGSEILVGKLECDDQAKYLLHGLNSERISTLNDQIRDIFKTGKDPYFKNIQSLDNDYTREYSKAFYHIDYFCMLVGRLPKFNAEGVFISTPYVYNPDNNKNVDQWWAETEPFISPQEPYPMRRTGGTMGNSIEFKKIELPMYLFPKRKNEPIAPDNIALVLSYANCIVENYRLRSWKECWHFDNDEDRKICSCCDQSRRINVYFPDYRDAMSRLIASVYSKKEDRKSNLTEVHSDQQTDDSILSALLILFENWRKEENENEQHVTRSSGCRKSRRDAFRSMNAFFDRVHLHIREKLAKHDIHNVTFLKHDFFALAQSEGALHCIAKVVERDLVN